MNSLPFLLSLGLSIADIKKTENTKRTWYYVFPDKRLCFLAGKSHPTLLRGWLRDTEYRIWPYLLRFATICHYFPLFAAIRDCSPLCELFEVIRSTRTIRIIRYSLFAIRDYSLFVIRDYSLFANSGFPDTPKCGPSRWNGSPAFKTWALLANKWRKGIATSSLVISCY